MPVNPETAKVEILPMNSADLDVADHVMRLAFGTFLGLPEPTSFMGDSGYVRSRFAADPASAFVARSEGEVIGSNFATRWGSLAFFGPLTVHPRLWDGGVGARLVEAVMQRFDDWDVGHRGLFTFPESPKHVALYRRFGFWPRSLTAVMRKPVDPTATGSYIRLSALSPADRSAAVAACAAIADAVHPGLDLTGEIEAAAGLGLGDTVLIENAAGIAGFAVCHSGAGSEAGSNACYVKFGAVLPGSGEDFDTLLSASEALAARLGAQTLDAGCSYSRPDALSRMNATGFRTWLNGVSMHNPDQPAYHRPDAYVIDDWR